MYPILIQLGSFQLRTYGVIVALSFILAVWLSTREAKRKGLDPALIQDFAFYALLGGIAGARIYFVVFSNPAYFLVFLLVWSTRTKSKIEGSVFLTYPAGYGAARLFVEFFRGNPAIFAWGIPAAQVVGVAPLLSSIAGYFALRSCADQTPLAAAPGKQDAPKFGGGAKGGQGGRASTIRSKDAGRRSDAGR